MHKSAAIALGLSLALAGCREPTAPEMHTIAKSVEQKFAAGDLRGVHQMFMSIGSAGDAWGLPEAQNEAMHILRDGVPMVINGFVFEEIFVPPNGGGRPLIRRSVAGWPKDFAFAVFAVSDIHPGTATPNPDGSDMRHSGFTNMLMHIRGDSLGAWVPHGGTVDIGESVLDRECGRSTTVVPRGHAPERVTCHLALFDVSVKGELITERERRARVIPSVEHRHRLEIPRQRLPGIRFVTTCPPRPDRSNWECGHPFWFWRDNALYAPALGIDIGRMKLLEGGLYAIETWADGRQPESFIVHWSLHTPDGAVVRSGTGWDLFNVSDTGVNLWDVRPDIPRGLRHMKAIFPATDIDPSASPYTVFVLSLEVRRR
jgi:hypothetical protein